MDVLEAWYKISNSIPCGEFTCEECAKYYGVDSNVCERGVIDRKEALKFIKSVTEKLKERYNDPVCNVSEDDLVDIILSCD